MTLVFRSHDEVPAVSSAIYGQLLREWVALNAGNAPRIALRRWARSDPVFANMVRPADVVDAIDSGAPARKDEILHALVAQFQKGQQLAGRIALQAMLPALSSLARRCRSAAPDDFEGRRHMVLATFWCVLEEFPLHRCTSGVAGRLKLDTLHQITRPEGGKPDDLVPVDPTTLEAQGVETLAELHDSGTAFRYTPMTPVGSERTTSCETQYLLTDGARNGDVVRSDDLLSVLHWANAQGVISDDESDMMVLAYCQPAREYQFDQVARVYGISRNNAKQRCSRVSRRIVAAVQQLVPIDAVEMERRDDRFLVLERAS